MIVVDSSAWVDFIRGADSPARHVLSRLLRERRDLAVTETVTMEVLAGARDDGDLRALRVRLAGFPVLPLRGLRDFEAAAELFRQCRRGGEAIRKLSDCLTAVPAIRARAPVLHADADFDKLDRHTPLEVYPLDE